MNCKKALLSLFTLLLTLPVWGQLGNVTGISNTSDSVTLSVGSDLVRVKILLPNVAEVDFRPAGQISANTLIIDPLHATKTWAPGLVTINTAANPATITTSAMVVKIAKNPLRISYYKTDGTSLIFKEPSAGGMSASGVKFDGWASNSLNWYGLQSAGSGRAWEGTAKSTYWGWSQVKDLKRNGVSAAGSEFPAPNMNVMPHGGQTGPFAWTLGNGSTPGFAVLWDNEGGSATLGNTLEMSKTGTIGTPLNPKTNTLWFAIIGSPYQIMDAMTQVTGRPSMFPKYSSGYINTEWGVDESELKTSIQTFRDRKIPLDVYTLDFDWKHWGEYNYGEFHWNPDKFPSAASGKLKEFFQEQGNHIMAITKPRIHRNTPQGDYAFAQGWFNGQTGPNNPISFLNDYFSNKPIGDLKFSTAATRDWFAQLTVDGASATGVDGWWNDEFEESGIRRGEAGNVYNVALQERIYDYQRQQFPGKRVWSNNRTSYLGSHRYGYSVWSGDVFLAWGQLQVEPARMLQVINAGLGRTATDGGGTSGGAGDDAWDSSNPNVIAAHMPQPELYARWIQYSSFMPLFRAHCANPLGQRQPWLFNRPDLGGNGETGAVEAIRFRSRLIPYIYSHERKYAETGIPIVRPLNWDSPADANLVNYSSAWMFGDSLLVSPVLKKQTDETSKSIYLPAGTWYDYFRGNTYVSSGANISYNINDPLWLSMPVFAKAGAIVPNYFHTPQHVGQGDQSQIQVDYFPSTALTSFDYYDDDGLSYSQESGEFFKQNISAQQTGTTVNLTLGARQGTGFTPPLEHYVVAIQRFKAGSVSVAGAAATQRASLADLRATAGEGWATGANAQGAVTYVKISAGTLRTLAATQAVAPSLAIHTSALPAGSVNVDYDTQLAGEGLGATVAWSLTSGAMPAGLNFDTKTGRIIGRPTTPGIANLTFQLASGTTGTRSLSLTVASLPLKAYEPFDYQGIGGGLEGAQGGAGFVDLWERKLGGLYDNPKYPTSIAFGNNAYGALSFTGHKAKLVRGSSGNRYSRLLQTPFVDDGSAKTLWLSFTATGTGAGNGGLALVRTAGGANDGLLVFGKKTGSPNWTYDAKVGSQPGAPTSVVANQSPALILAKIDVTNSTTRTVRMWVNPTLSGTPPADASAAIVTSQGASNLSFGRLELSFDGAPADDSIEIDEIRLGANYQDVISLTEIATIWKPQVTAAGVTGMAYNYQLIASGVPGTWALTGGALPGGLTLNPVTGMINGTPTAAGTYSATFTATNANGISAPVTLEFTVSPAIAPEIVSNQSATGQIGQSFNYAIASTGFPTSWTVSGTSTLPPGLSLNASSGFISGNPTTPGVYTTTFQAANTQGTSVVCSVTLNITAPLAGLLYDQMGGSLGASLAGLGGGGGSIGWGGQVWQTFNAGSFTIAAGLNFPGVPSAANSLRIDGNGYPGISRQFATELQRNNQTTWISFLAQVNRNALDGTFLIEFPDHTGQQFQIVAEKDQANWVFRRFSAVAVTNAPVVSGQTALILLKLEMNGGSSVYRMWINPPTGTQPSDATANGVMTGVSSFNFDKVQILQWDQVASCYFDEFRVGASWGDVMGAASIITPGQNPSAMQTIPFNYQVLASPAATSWSLASGTLPAGLTLNTATGVISGTVTTLGTFPTMLIATNAVGTSVPQTVTIDAVPLAQPLVTSGQSAAGVVGNAFSYQILSNYAINYSLFSGSLPPGVTLNAATGLLSGTPTTPGVYNPAFKVTNSAGTSAAVTVPFTITQLIAYEGFNYSAGTLAGRNGGTGWTQAWDSGQNETSVSGLGYIADSAALTTLGGKVILKDGGSYANYRNLPATYSNGTYWLSFIATSTNPGVAWGGLSLFNGSSEQLFIGQRYASVNWGLEKAGTGVNSAGNTGLKTLLVVKLVLKAGGDDVYLWTNPQLDSVPADSSATQWLGAVDISVNRIRLQQGLGSGKTMDVDEIRFGNTFAEVAPSAAVVLQAPVVTDAQTAAGTVGQAFNYMLTASNNPTSWALASGSLPPGITLNTLNGVLSGTPSTSGAFTPSFTASNAVGTSPGKVATLTIASVPLPVITANQSAAGTVNQPFSYTVTAANNPTSWVLSSGSLPVGVTLNTATGALTGTPSGAGVFTPSFIATNASGTSAPQSVTLTISNVPVPVISPNQSVSGTVGQVFSYAVVAANSPTAWALASGSLPPGLSLNLTNGVISGTPTTAGTYTPGLTATSAVGTSLAQAVTITVSSSTAPVNYRIMTLGDSITGFYKYQPPLKTQLTANGYTYEMVGTQGSAPNQHEGIGGIGINGIDDTINTKLNTVFGNSAPASGVRNIVMLQAGVNNMNHGLGISGAQANGFPRDAAGNAIAPQFANPLSGSYLNGLGTLFGNSTYGTGYLTTTAGNLLDKITNHASQPWLVVARIAPVGKGNANYNANTDNCTARINEFNNILAAKVAAMQVLGRKVVLVDNFSSADRNYGTSPPSDFGTQTEQGGQNVTDGQASSNNGDWVHPRTNAPIWQSMANHFYSGFQQLIGNNYSISGTVTLAGNGLAAVTVSDGTRTALTDSSGSYTLSGVGNGAYTVTASKAGYTFSPSSLAVTISGANQTGSNFVASALPTFSIGGTVSVGGSGLAGVIVSDANGNTAATNASGIYLLAGLPQGSYTITPNKAGYTFIPASRSGSISANLSNTDFTGVFQAATYEPFDYAAGIGALANKNGGGNWGGAWDGGANDLNAAGLAYASSGTLNASGGKVILKDGTASFRNFPATYSSGTYWVSLLAKSSAPGVNWGGIALFDGSNERLFIGQRYGQSQWGLERNGTGVTSTVNTGSVAFLVVRITLQAGNDAVHLWVNPSLSGTPSDAGGLLFDNLGDFSFNRIRAMHGLGGGQILELDELRVGQSFAEVAPLTVSGSAPTILNKPLATAEGTVGLTLNYSVTASGSPAPVFSVSSGVLPDGLTLNAATGLISGTPAMTSVGNVTLTATNSAGSDSTGLTFAIAAPMDPILVGTVTGSAPWAGDMSHAAQAVFDGNTGTFFAPDGTNTFARIDLGSSLRGRPTTIRYFPRSGFEGRMISGKFQGSLDGVAWVDLHTVVTNPPLAWTQIMTANTTYFRYLRFYNPGLADVGEVEFRGLTQAVTNGLETFRGVNGLPQDGSQDRATPAGDGVENLLKFAFNMLGSDPGQALTLNIPNTAVTTVNSNAGLPLIGLDGEGKLTLTFIRRRATSAPGVTYAVEFSNSLVNGSWAVNPLATESVTIVDATFERVVARDSLANAGKRFARVRVVGN